jgi:hypothetical protein
MEDGETDPLKASFTCDEDGQWWFAPPVGETRLKVDGEEVWCAQERYRWGSRAAFAVPVVAFVCIFWFDSDFIAWGWPKWSPLPFAIGALLLSGAIRMLVGAFALGSIRKRWLALETQRRELRGI